MTNEKARDFFSAYFEGTLEPGLCVSFEQKLKADQDLQHEYQSFADAMEHLGVLKFEDIHIPEDLHERISARLDRHIFDKKRTAAPAWSLWLRGIGLAGACALAIGGAIFFVNSKGNVGSAGVVVPQPSQIRYTTSADGVTLRLTPSTTETVVIRDEQGKELSRTQVGTPARPELKTMLSNSLDASSLFQVEVGGVSRSFVVIPGHKRETSAVGEGTLLDFAKAASGFYHVPVKVDSGSPTERMNWNLASSDVVGEASKALRSGYTVTQLSDGLLEIEQK